MEPTKRRLTGQLRIVLAYLIEHGTITNREAMFTLGVGRLASRISELRALGMVVISAHPEAGKRYVAYSLGDKVAARAFLSGGALPDVTPPEIIGGAPQPPNKSAGDEARPPVHGPNKAHPGCIDKRAAGVRR